MSHQNSQVKAPINDHVLVIGISPEAFTPEELAAANMTMGEVTAQIAQGWAAIQADGTVGELCHVGKDPDAAEAEIRQRLAGRSFGVALIGSGVRLRPQSTLLLERIVNVLIELQPGIQLGFPTGPDNMHETLRRRLDR